MRMRSSDGLASVIMRTTGRGGEGCATSALWVGSRFELDPKRCLSADLRFASTPLKHSDACGSFVFHCGEGYGFEPMCTRAVTSTHTRDKERWQCISPLSFSSLQPLPPPPPPPLTRRKRQL